MDWKPNKYIAAVLGIFALSFAMLYVARVRWAVFYFVASISVVGLEFYFSAPWLRLMSLANVVAVVCAIHAFRVAAISEGGLERPWYSRWYSLVGLYVAMLMAVFSFRAFLYEPFRMPSGSMLPTIKSGSYVLVQKYGYGNYGTFGLKIGSAGMTTGISRGDLIVFDYPVDLSVQYVKRVIGIPGDTVVYKDNYVLINGKQVETDDVDTYTETVNGRSYKYRVKREWVSGAAYLVQYRKGAPQSDFSVILPPGNYFVLGDNRDNSRDSRYWGFVPEDNIVGKVVYVTK